MNGKPPSRHDHPADAASKKSIEHLHPEAKLPGIKSQQQPY